MPNNSKIFPEEQNTISSLGLSHSAILKYGYITKTINWLLSGNPSIKWQVMRGLLWLHHRKDTKKNEQGSRPKAGEQVFYPGRTQLEGFHKYASFYPVPAVLMDAVQRAQCKARL